MPIEPLRALGHVEGRNLAFDYRSAAGDPPRLPALAEELVRLHPDILVAGPVQTLARPGGNVTGLSGQSAEFKSKQPQLAEMAVSNQRVIGVLYNPDTP